MRTVFNPPRNAFVPVHGHTVAKNGGRSATYISWQNMHARCKYPSVPSYKNYGARGIKVCARWSDFSAFLADMGERPSGHSIDRLDSDADYSPENCRWATPKQQNDPARKRAR
jgi:hypothetical protein